MSKSSWSSVFTHSDSDTVDGSAILEEFLDGPLFGSESKITDEDGVGFTSWSSSATLWLVSTSSLSTEFNPDLSPIERLLVGTVESSSGVFVVGVLNKCFSLGLAHAHEELALGKLTVFSEEFSQAILVGLEGKTLNEELRFTIVLVTDGSGILSSSWGGGGLNLGLFFIIRARIRSGR